jgi:3',5'-cyclic AMP phosphodiesterase CpdA
MKLPLGFFLIWFIATGLLAGCDLIEYNPNEIVLDDDEENLNALAMERISQNDPGDTLSFILMGDSQRFYDDVEDFVKSVNSLDRSFDFVVHTGDIADFGLVDEFRWVHGFMKNLKVPYIAVVGNHDLLANGPRIYRRMYGSFNFVFDYGKFRLIFLNSNSREYNFSGNIPDLNWLSTQLNETNPGSFPLVISHIPPWDGDFDPLLEEPYANLLAEQNKVLSLHGHIHNYLDSVYYNDGVRYFVSTSMNKRGYTYVQVWGGGSSFEKISF